MPPRHKKSRRSHEGSDGLIISLKNDPPKNKIPGKLSVGVICAVFHYARTTYTRHKLSGRFSGSHPTSRPLPISYGQWNDYLSDLPATADNGCTQRRDHHGFSPCSHFAYSARIRAKPQSFLSISQRATTPLSFTEIPCTLQAKNLYYSKVNCTVCYNIVYFHTLASMLDSTIFFLEIHRSNVENFSCVVAQAIHLIPTAAGSPAQG
jgi:hypothetical protein